MLLFNVSDNIIQSIKYRSGESYSDQDRLREILRACFNNARPTWNTLEKLSSVSSVKNERVLFMSFIRLYLELMTNQQ